GCAADRRLISCSAEIYADSLVSSVPSTPAYADAITSGFKAMLTEAGAGEELARWPDLPGHPWGRSVQFRATSSEWREQPSIGVVLGLSDYNRHPIQRILGRERSPDLSWCHHCNTLHSRRRRLHGGLSGCLDGSPAERD